jgi:WD40 repeat protein
VAFSPSGNLLASSSREDGSTRLWDIWSGKSLIRGSGRLLGFSRRGKRLAFQTVGRMGIWEVAEGVECRWLQPRGERTAAWRNYRGQESIDYSPDGRLLATAGGDGVRLWDTATTQELAYLPIGYHEDVVFHPSSHQLFTYGRIGLKSWPLATVPGQPGIQIGPGQALEVPPNTGWFHLCCSLDGRVLAVTDDSYAQILVLNVHPPSERVRLKHCPDVISLAVSPDGRWIAAGMVKGTVGIGIWDAHSGRLVQHFPAEKNGTTQFHVAFSPDGQWLVSGGRREYRFWKVGSWEAGPVIAREDLAIYAGPLRSCPLAFSRDGRMLALARSLDQVQLFDPVQQRPLATLTAPNARALSRLCFNHDGTELAASTDNHVVQLWDLRAIRRRLRAMDLDWDLPPYPPTTTR